MGGWILIRFIVNVLFFMIIFKTICKRRKVSLICFLVIFNGFKVDTFLKDLDHVESYEIKSCLRLDDGTLEVEWENEKRIIETTEENVFFTERQALGAVYEDGVMEVAQITLYGLNVAEFKISEELDYYYFFNEQMED